MWGRRWGAEGTEKRSWVVAVVEVEMEAKVKVAGRRCMRAVGTWVGGGGRGGGTSRVAGDGGWACGLVGLLGGGDGGSDVPAASVYGGGGVGLRGCSGCGGRCGGRADGRWGGWGGGQGTGDGGRMHRGANAGRRGVALVAER